MLQSKQTALLWIIIPFLTFFAIHPACAQSNVDSLTAVLNKYPKADTVRAKVLIALSDALEKVDAKKGIAYSDKALAILENFPALELKADALSTKAQHLKDLAKRNEALDLAEQSLKIYEQLHLTKKVADVYNLLGKIYDDESDLETGKKYYERALALGEQVGDMKVKMLALNGLGLICLGSSDYKNGILNFEQGNGLGLFLVGAMLQGEQIKVVFDSPEVGGTIAKVLG
jgi:tetratricopeptide (TPR) repeat protein